MRVCTCRTGVMLQSEEDRKETTAMRLMDVILMDCNIDDAIDKVKANKGSAGIDGMDTSDLDAYMDEHREELIQSVRDGSYKPQPVKRVYIPKPNGKKRPLGIPTVVDRVIQQAVADILSEEFDETFSDFSYGFRPMRSAHQAINQALQYLNEGYEWIVDLDIEKFFDRVNQDKLISCIRERVNETEVLGLIRKFLKAGIMENGVKQRSDRGTPQGGNLSPLLANIYLDKFDKELEKRGLRFVRYADDVIIFTKSEAAANRVMASTVGWLDRKLFLTASAEKTKVVRPTNSKYLGFTFWKSKGEWRAKPHKSSKDRLKQKIRLITKRNKAQAIPLAATFKKLNQTIKGWINYYRIGDMKSFMITIGQWLRHRVRVVILKQWKRRGTIFNNLCKIYKKFGRHKLDEEYIYAQCMTRVGWYKLGNNEVVNSILSPQVLGMPNKKENRPGLIDPLEYYLARAGK